MKTPTFSPKQFRLKICDLLRIFVIALTACAGLWRGGQVQAHSATPVPGSASSKLYMPLLSLDLNLAITGQILDENFRPVAGIVVKANSVFSATSGADGVYAIEGLKAGTYTVTPQNTNRYYFQPTSQTVPLPGSGAVNFSARPSGGEYINNGSFENATAWTIDATNIPAEYTTRASKSGTRSMQGGIYDKTVNRAGYSKFRQMAPIPNQISAAHLSFWMYPTSSESSSADFSSVYLLDENGKTLVYLLLEQLRKNNEWIKYQFDLSAYAGKYVTIVFSIYNDGLNGITAMMVDDVSLIITP